VFATGESVSEQALYRGSENKFVESSGPGRTSECVDRLIKEKIKIPFCPSLMNRGDRFTLT